MACSANGIRAGAPALPNSFSAYVLVDADSLELVIACAVRNQRDRRDRMDHSGMEAFAIVGTTSLDLAVGNRARCTTSDCLRSGHSGSGVVASCKLAAESKRDTRAVDNECPSLPRIHASVSGFSFAMDARATLGLSDGFFGVSDLEGRQFRRDCRQSNSNDGGVAQI